MIERVFEGLVQFVVVLAPVLVAGAVCLLVERVEKCENLLRKKSPNWPRNTRN